MQGWNSRYDGNNNTAELTLTYQIQNLVLEIQDIENIGDFNRALFKGPPVEDVHGIYNEEKQIVKFLFDGSKSAMELCHEVREKIISGFNVNQ